VSPLRRRLLKYACDRGTRVGENPPVKYVIHITANIKQNKEIGSVVISNANKTHLHFKARKLVAADLDAGGALF
jgi:hypothetical protein